MDSNQTLRLSQYIKPKKAQVILMRARQALGVDVFVFDQRASFFLSVPSTLEKEADQLQRFAEAHLTTMFSVDKPEPIHDEHGWWVPLLTRNTPVGIIFLRNFDVENPKKQQAQAQMIAEGLTYMAEEEFKLKDMSSQLIENYEELNLLYDISRKTSSITDLEYVKQSIVLDAVEIINADNGFLILEDDETGDYFLENVYHPDILDQLELNEKRIRIKTDKGIISHVLLEGESKILNDAPSTLFFEESEKSITIDSILVAPLETTHKILGMLVLINKGEGEIFTSGDQKLLSAMAHQAAQSIENASLFKKLEYEKHIVERIIETTADGIIVASQVGEIQRFNREAKQIFHLDIERLPTGEDVAANSRLSLMMRKILDNPSHSGSFEMIVMKPEKLFISIHTNPLQDSAGRTIGLVASVRNLTDMKKAEREKREIVSLLAQKLPALSEEIVSLVIHEPRKKTKESDKDGIIRADQLGEVAVDLDRRITRLRRFLQIIAGPLRIERVETELEPLMKKILERYPAAITNSKFKVKVKYRNEIGLLKVDRDHFIELIDILIENVVDHAGDGNIVLNIEFERVDETLIGVFTDNGQGISEYLVSLLFEPTEQLTEHEELRLDEIGLGLPYAKHVIEGHGGDITVHANNEDKDYGCRVEFRIHVGSQDPF